MSTKWIMELCGCKFCDCQYMGMDTECDTCLSQKHYELDGHPHWLRKEVLT